MGFTVDDFKAFVQLSEEHPELRHRLAQSVMSDEFARLPDNVERIAEAQARSDERMARVEVALDRIATSQAQSEARLDRIETTLERLVKAQAATEKKLDQLAQAQTRSEQRLNRVEAALERLTEAQAATEARLERLADAQAKTEQRLERLAEAQAKSEQRLGRVEAAIERLAEAQAKTEQRLEQLVSRVGSLEDTVGDMKGTLLEVKYREGAPAYFGRLVRGIQRLSPQLLDEQVEPQLSRDDFDDVLQLDLLFSGRPRHLEQPEEVWLAIEVSSVIDRRDVERARRRAALLRQAGRPAVAVVAGEALTIGAEEALAAQDVVLVRDGRTEYWEQAVAGLQAA